jgi:hypothetical protein
VFSVAEWQAHAPRILRGGHAARVSLRVYGHCYTAALPTTGRSGPPPCPRIRPPSARIFPLPAFTESQTNFPPKYGHSTFGFAPQGVCGGITMSIPSKTPANACTCLAEASRGQRKSLQSLWSENLCLGLWSGTTRQRSRVFHCLLSASLVQWCC